MAYGDKGAEGPAGGADTGAHGGGRGGSVGGGNGNGNGGADTNLGIGNVPAGQPGRGQIGGTGSPGEPADRGRSDTFGRSGNMYTRGQIEETLAQQGYDQVGITDVLGTLGTMAFGPISGLAGAAQGLMEMTAKNQAAVTATATELGIAPEDVEAAMQSGTPQSAPAAGEGEGPTQLVETTPQETTPVEQGPTLDESFNALMERMNDPQERIDLSMLEMDGDNAPAHIISLRRRVSELRTRV